MNDSHEVETWTTWVPLERLRGPETDVRVARDRAGVESLAQSMGNPDVGQLQAAYGWFPEDDELDEEDGQEAIRAVYQSGNDVQLTDGATRWRAAEMLGWDSLRVEIWPREPPEEMLASLEANTERLDMSSFETARAIRMEYEKPDVTLKDVGEAVGLSEGYISQVVSSFDEPEWLVDLWQDPEAPIETGPILELRKLPTERLKEVQAQQVLQHELSVTATRQRCRAKVHEWRREQEDDRTIDEKRNDARAEQADSEVARGQTYDQEERTCDICGGTAHTKIALDVCESDYGVINQARQTDKPLMGPQTGGRADSGREPAQNGESGVSPDAVAEAVATGELDPAELEDAIMRRAETDG